jgi:hypothetical protein
MPHRLHCGIPRLTFVFRHISLLEVLMHLSAIALSISEPQLATQYRTRGGRRATTAILTG